MLQDTEIEHRRGGRCAQDTSNTKPPQRLRRTAAIARRRYVSRERRLLHDKQKHACTRKAQTALCGNDANEKLGVYERTVR